MNANQKVHSTKLAIWNEHFKNHASSGLTVKNYCLQNNISLYAFYYWKRIAKESFVDSILPDIVPLSANPESNNTLVASPEVLSESCNLYNSLDFARTHISAGDINIDIGSNASDELILNII